MSEGNIEKLKNEIKRRERELKQARAKTLHPGDHYANDWISGKHLDYRYDNAKEIIRDIFESEKSHA